MHKQNISPINAIAQGLLDGGCQYTTNFPGFHSHEIFERLGGKQISLNEKLAFQMAFGASLAGKRSVTTMKSTGLNVSLDEYLHSILNGINAGLVLVLTEDLTGESSPERQDSRVILDLYGGLWLEPTSIQNAYDLAYKSFELSERLDIPIVIRLTNEFFNADSTYERKPSKRIHCKMETRRKKYISHWHSRYQNLTRKNQRIIDAVEKLYNHANFKHQNPNAAIRIGMSTTNNKKNQDVAKVHTYPLPIKSLQKFLKNRKKIEVYERGNKYAYYKIQTAICNPVTVNSITDLNNPLKPSSWPLWSKQEKLFWALKKVNPSYVVADEGTYTDESTKTTNVCLCMGSSVGITMGLAINNTPYPFCITGDTAFMFQGVHSLIEAQHRKLKFGVIIIDNGGAQSTGGQNIIGNLTSLSIKAKTQTIDYDYSTVDDFENVFNQMKKSNKLSILYVKT